MLFDRDAALFSGPSRRSLARVMRRGRRPAAFLHRTNSTLASKRSPRWPECTRTAWCCEGVGKEECQRLILFVCIGSIPSSGGHHRAASRHLPPRPPPVLIDGRLQCSTLMFEKTSEPSAAGTTSAGGLATTRGTRCGESLLPEARIAARALRW